MEKMQSVRQGGTVSVAFDRGGESLSGWTCQLIIKKFPGSTPDVDRAITAVGGEWPTFITQTESALLDVAVYYMIGKMANTTTDEEQQVELRLMVQPAWA